MGLIDWLGNVGRNIVTGFKDVKDKLGTGINWIHQKITTPIANTLRSVPVVGDVVNAAQPILDLAGKVGPALQGKGGLSIGDVTRAVAAVPGTIAAGQGALATGRSYMSQMGAARRLVA
jgi:hypothetical protein